MTAEVRLALIAAVLSFAGGLLGSQYSSSLERQRDVEKLNVDWKVRLIEKRIDVFQRCVGARGQIDYFNDLRLELAKERANPVDPKTLVDDRKRRWEVESTLAGMTQAQYTCIAMASSIFQNRSRDAAAAIVISLGDNSDWLRANLNNGKLTVLFTSMLAEMGSAGKVSD